MQIRKIVAVGASMFGLTLLSALGCSSSSSAGTPSNPCGSAGDKNCPNDPPQTQAAADQCNKCKSQASAVASCQPKPGCGADGKTVASTTIPDACKQPFADYIKCASM